MRPFARSALVLGVLMVTAGCTQVVPGGGGAGPANAWAHEMTQADELRTRGLTGAGVTIAVVDTGVDAQHQELAGVPTTWRDFVNEQSEPYDDHGHGTHVSGLAVAQGVGGANDPLIQGVAPGAELIHAKAIKGNGEGGESQDVADAIDWSVRQGADVLVLSLGQRPRLLPLGSAVEDAVNRALDEGVVVVAAAGNAPEGGSGEDCEVSSPANVPLVIAVGAVREDKQIAPFSCTGGSGKGPLGVQEREHPNKKPELTAPGVKLVGPWPGRACGRTAAQYCVLSGTSQATPIVGGIVALLLEENPNLARQDRQAIEHIKQAVRQTAEKVGFTGHHARYGYGIVQGQSAAEWLASNEMGQDAGQPLPPLPPSG